MHALRGHLVIDSRAELPADGVHHQRHALCLQILVTAVQIWNARYMDAAIEHFHTNHRILPPTTKRSHRIAPVHHAHINPVGRYDLARQP